VNWPDRKAGAVEDPAEEAGICSFADPGRRSDNCSAPPPTLGQKEITRPSAPAARNSRNDIGLAERFA
jgi:hypothetical protein